MIKVLGATIIAVTVFALIFGINTFMVWAGLWAIESLTTWRCPNFWAAVVLWNIVSMGLSLTFKKVSAK